ncbi:MAG: ribosome maturation factor RimM [Thermoleophilia bacterium]|nr:ribosome maturation factor RimM [Thermoleophilia bacterium]
MARPEWIEVGRITRPHGVHGEVRITPDSDNPERFAPGSVVHARPRQVGIAGSRLQEQVCLTVESVRGDGDFPIVAFREIEDRDAAEALHGYVLEVRSSELPELEEDEFYPFDLIGLEARDGQGAVVGRVSDVIESPAHPIVVIALASGGEAMVPFVQVAVPAVDIAEGYLTIESGFVGDGPL